MNVENPVVNYDVVGSITQFLILAAMKKQVVLFSQLVTACHSTDLDQVMRGNVKGPFESIYTTDEILTAIDEITQRCLERSWPPLTVLITKDGKYVGQGFWEKGPYGDIRDASDIIKRRLELEGRKACYRYFDAFSPLNDKMQNYIERVWRIVKASREQFPDLEEALGEASNISRNGAMFSRSSSEIRALMEKNISIDWNAGKVISYNQNVLLSHRQRNTQHFSVVVPLNQSVDIISRALAPIYQTLEEGEAIGFPYLEKLEILGAVTKENTTLLHKDFGVQPAATGDARQWNITGAIYKHERGEVPEGEDWAWVAGQVNTHTGEAVFSVKHPTAAGLLVRLSIYVH